MVGSAFSSWAAVAAISAGLSGGLIFILKPLLVRHLLAHPNTRSSHVSATPQGAGLAVMAVLLAVSLGAGIMGLIAPPPNLIPILIGAAILTVIGVLDDAHALAVSWRLLAQALVAFTIVFLLPPDFRILPGLLALSVERVLLALGVIGFVNAINFLDGLDWMTVVQVVPMTLGVAILGSLGVVPANIGFLAVVLLGATLGFAIFNKHPARIFLGDAGSLPIGLVLAYLLLYVAEANIASCLLLALYTLADSLLTFSRRLINGEQVFQAHRTHFYQRAVANGLTVPQVTARVFLLGLWLASLAIAAGLARSTAFDVMALLFGLCGTAFLLLHFSREH
jgi:UDP-N-acetylmuramyl pentapeptide phosphotransferase/UDP-N-acetylglucosamine-1-phosphate transferase